EDHETHFGRDAMQITGQLKNASGSGKDDVFAGYAVELRYYVVADPAPPTYRQVEDRIVLQGTEPSFTFTLPDAHQLGLEQELRVVVRNRQGERVYEQAGRLAEVIRAERPLTLPIQQVEALVVLTPVTLRGRLRWKQAGKTDSFEGFTARVRFQA